MKINRFEDLPLWREARTLSREVYQSTSKSIFKDFSLRDQMRRAIISVSSNIAEGFERGSNKEFIQFLFIAKGSVGELRSQIYSAYDNNYIIKNKFDYLIEECVKISRNISNFIGYLKNSKITSFRHKEK